RQHPTVTAFPAGLSVYSFDEYYENGDSFEEVYEKIINRILELGRRPEGVTYAVPGNAFVAEATAPEIVKRAREAGIKVKVIEGLSFLEPVFSALGIDPYPSLTLVDAIELGQLHHPSFPPTFPVLISQVYSRPVAADLKLTLMAVYPDEYPVKLVHAAGTEREKVEELCLYEIDRSDSIGLMTALYLPAMDKYSSFESFQEIIARLRAPDGCPWDREQTHASLRPHLLEETYEALSALDEENLEGLVEEFGDVLLQVVLHSQIASEDGEFRMSDILEGVSKKLIRRHPHVFGDVKVNGADGVIVNWEKIKEGERKAKKVEKVKGLLDGVPISLPALAQALAYQDRASRVGFDWHTIDGVIEKIAEELDELKNAEDDTARAEEMGDLFFSIVNLARW
ncbi:MAG: nucleoside triphosphate pyrophosphohydrolase, partial [Anaerolineae bacterium]|nr:nucleoside triphosphate pyrophosphohydrolase [Anaerolineae bacterium]